MLCWKWKNRFVLVSCGDSSDFFNVIQVLSYALGKRSIRLQKWMRSHFGPSASSKFLVLVLRLVALAVSAPRRGPRRLPVLKKLFDEASLSYSACSRSGLASRSRRDAYGLMEKLLPLRQP